MMNANQVQREFDANVTEVLSRFENVEHAKHRGKDVPDKWTAKCPSCGGGRALEIKRLLFGKIKFHCYCGCTGDEILEGAGLDAKVIEARYSAEAAE